MKKSIIIISLFTLVLFSSCVNNTVKDPTTSSSTFTNETTYTSSITQDFSSTTQNNHQKVTATSAVTKPTEKENLDQTDEVPPYILTVSLDDIKQIKYATQKLSEEEFVNYMKTNYSNEAANGMDTLFDTQKLLEELESSYMLVLDGNESNYPDISFYWERNEFHQMIYFNEEERVVGYISTPNDNITPETYFGHNENAVLVKSVNNDNYSADIYTLDGRDNFFIDVTIGNSYIFLRTHDIHTLENCEADFKRLSFVKIGDLLNK